MTFDEMLAQIIDLLHRQGRVSYKVRGTLPRRSPIVSRSARTLSQFVGRERELATLEELFTQGESGNGQVIGIVAEAGQGKSRLLYEFRQRLQDKQVTYLFQETLATFSSIQSRFEMARAHLDLAALVHTQGKPDSTTVHLSTAHTWFNKLQVPKYVERTEQLAQEYGVTLTEIELEEVTEGSS